ncbi:MAG TPA: response regulator transcription factor [Gemmatimonadaceae bacterium]|nr:response regulator transcription factor [Gemmatimonadaceae bacterium]
MTTNGNGHRPRVLIVEDNANLALGLRNNLEIEGYDVDVARDGASGLAAARAEPAPDLVILDLMLPEMDGYRVLRTLRDEGRGMPVLILTARGEEAEKVRGFRLGADDYVTKPFGLLELLARVNAHLRRARGPAAPDESGSRRGDAPSSGAAGRGAGLPPLVAFGEIRVEPLTHAVFRAGRPVALRPKEFDLLIALIRRRGRVATRLELLREVWEYDHSVISRTVDTHVAELRRKLEDDPAAPRHILTVRKTGYRLQE